MNLDTRLEELAAELQRTVDWCQLLNQIRGPEPMCGHLHRSPANGRLRHCARPLAHSSDHLRLSPGITDHLHGGPTALCLEPTPQGHCLEHHNHPGAHTPLPLHEAERRWATPLAHLPEHP